MNTYTIRHPVFYSNADGKTYVSDMACELREVTLSAAQSIGLAAFKGYVFSVVAGDNTTVAMYDGTKWSYPETKEAQAVRAADPAI